MKLTLHTFLAAAALAVGLDASAQAQYFGSAKVDDDNDIVAEQVGVTTKDSVDIPSLANTDSINAVVVPDTAAVAAKLAKSGKVAEIPDSVRYRVRSVEELYYYLDTLDMRNYDNLMGSRPLPKTFFLPSVYTGYEFPDTTSAFSPELSGNPGLEWIEEEMALQRKIKAMNYYLYSTHPERVVYNINLLPEAPKEFHAVVDPEKHTIKIEEIATKEQAVTPIDLAPGRKRHWTRNFSVSLHFAQGFVSPNWYGGGENNVNGQVSLSYHVELNKKYHPNLTFVTDINYGLGAQSAKNDTVRGYNVNNDQLRVSTRFGLHAVKRWDYSINASFNTRLFNLYQGNSHNLLQSLFSPGNIHAGVGMTYNYGNKKGNFNVSVSINPLAFDMKTCLNSKINPQSFGIKEGHKTLESYGSNTTINMSWRIAYNISMSSYLYAFTDFKRAYADWNNQINFTVNRYLSTTLQWKFRYDTDTRRCDNPSWKKLQMWESLSFGLTYNFSTI